MRNWSVEEQKLKKFPVKYKRWKTEQLINYGLDEGDKLDRQYVKQNLNSLDIDPDMKAYLKFVLQDEN